MIRIENFKVPIYYHDTLRKAKKNEIDIESLFGNKEDFEKNFKEFVSNIISKVKLSAIYSNLTINDFLQTIKTKELDLNDKPKKINNLTVACLTTGSEVENYLLSQMKDEKKLSLITLNVYLKTAITAVTDMIMEEAKKENSEISKPYFIHSPFDFENNIVLDSGIESILTKLQTEKIGIKIDNGSLTPSYSVLFFVYWNLKRMK